jgi:ATP-dependent RNA circularization protein (DNA/RNA ligase family)
MVHQLRLNHKLKAYNKELVLQGELCGVGIQKNKYKLKELDLFIFTVYDIKTDTWYGIDGIRKVCEDLGLKMVPVLGIGTLKENFSDVSISVNRSKGLSILTPVQREGIVVRQYDNSIGAKGLSFKVINPEFLLGLGDDE